MVAILILGGLGNQMFQYAAAKTLATRRGVDLIIDTGAFQTHESRTFLLDQLCIPELADWSSGAGGSQPPSRFAKILWMNRLNRILNRFGIREFSMPRGTYSEPHLHFDPNFFDLDPGVLLHGYFQSERYFGEIADDIRRYFRPRHPLSARAQDLEIAIRGASMPISVHIRRGDYVQSAVAARVHGTLGADYYERSIRVMLAMLTAKPTLFVFSDDTIEAIRTMNFLQGHEIIFVEGNTETPWEDLALMSLCHHHVIANSSFSWWGAWLNPSQEKVVVAPRAWFSPAELRSRNVCDLCPPTWILV